MKAVPGRGPVTSSAEIQPNARPSKRREGRDRDRHSEADDQGPERKHEQARPTSYQRQPQRGHGDELRTEHHRADHQDLGVQHDRDPCEQCRHRHEREVGPVELGLLVGPLRDFGPHDSVGAAARSALLRLEPGPGDPGDYGVDVHACPPAADRAR